jgi:probable O-glycosylation ligase (exosortase A-associated)
MYAGLVVACLAACVGTFERTAVVGVCVLAVGFWLRSRRKFLFGAMVAVVMIAAGSYVATSESDWAMRMKTIGTYSQDTSAYGRILVWRWTLNFVQDHPFGGGFNAYLVDQFVVPGTPDHPDPFIDRGRAFHSAYFEMLGEHGWVGLGLFLGLCAATFLTLRSAAVRARRLAGMAWCSDLARALQLSLMLPMVCGNFIGIAFQAEFYYLFALSVMLRHQVRTAEQMAAAARAPVAFDVELEWAAA